MTFLSLSHVISFFNIVSDTNTSSLSNTECFSLEEMTTQWEHRLDVINGLRLLGYWDGNGYISLVRWMVMDLEGLEGIMLRTE